MNPIDPNAVIIEGTAHNGHTCRLIDNTGGIPRPALVELFNKLISERRFGNGGLSPTGGNTITIGAPRYGHIQLGDELYRLLVFPYEARIERF
ncbi:MAG: hypothetical protein ACYDDO_05075 [Acidiferrobacterales bacterium]